MASQSLSQTEDILQAFQQVYSQLMQKVERALAETADSTVLGCIRDEITGYQKLLMQVCILV